MTDTTPDPQPVAPETEPEQIFPSATGVVVPGEAGGDPSDSADDSVGP